MSSTRSSVLARLLSLLLVVAWNYLTTPVFSFSPLAAAPPSSNHCHRKVARRPPRRIPRGTRRRESTLFLSAAAASSSNQEEEEGEGESGGILITRTLFTGAIAFAERRLRRIN
jgi:hypothetical protein